MNYQDLDSFFFYMIFTFYNFIDVTEKEVKILKYLVDMVELIKT